MDEDRRINAMDGAYLLVIDSSGDRAQVINSFLRNAGLAVQVVNAFSFDAVETILKEKSPFMLLVGTQLPPGLTITQILQAAEQFQTAVVMQLKAGETMLVEAAVSNHSVQVINAEHNGQLIDLVKQTTSAHQATRELDKLQHKLNEIQHRYDLLLDSARDSIAYIHEGLHVYANRAYLELLEVKNLAEISGLSVLDLMTSNSGDHLKQHLRDMSQDFFSPEPLAVTIHTPTGKQLQTELTFLPVKFNGEQCIQMMVHKHDSNLVREEELERLRSTDQLTQMLNRKTFTARLNNLIETEQIDNCPGCVLYLETDGIADLQQQLGMDGIDTYILDLANVINACLEDTDLPARFSDYGFVVLLKRDDKPALQNVADSIISHYSNHIIDLGDQTLTASCSIGMTSIGSLTPDAAELIGQARAAFREASKAGKTLARYKPALTTVNSGASDRDWVERIRYALNNHDFYTVQESIVNLEGENEGLFENRTFMREEDCDTPASEFMPAGERNDLGSNIDRHIIPQVLAAIAGTDDQHIISLSSNSILDFSFPSWFQRMLKETGAKGSQLILQFSTLTAESNLRPTRRVIDELRDVCGGFILSEFDNDRRNLQLLEHLPVNMIKLRPGLAHNLSSNTANQEIIRSVVRAVEPYAITIIAGEVKDASDLAVLWQCGVKLVTGDFLNEAPQVMER